MMKTTYEAFTQEDRNIRELVGYLKELQKNAPARVYVGLPTTWGKDFAVGAVPMYAVLSVEKLDALSYLYHAMSLNADIQVHFDETDPTDYNLFNVGYVVAPKERTFPEFVRPIRSFNNWVVYKVQTSGYFDLVHSDIAFHGTKENWYRANFQWLKSGLLKAKQHPSIFVRNEGGPYREWLNMGESITLPAATELPQNQNGEIVSERIDNQTYSASVVTKEWPYLLFKMTYHPNWHVSVDNVARETVMLAPSFIGVRLEPGEHQISFKYEPPRYKTPLLVLGFVTLVLLFFLEKKLISLMNAF